MKRSKGVNALLLVSVMVFALAATPARAHVTRRFDHLWATHIAPRLGNAGVLNSVENPVAWTKLKGVPAGLADGTDNVGTPGVTGRTVEKIELTIGLDETAANTAWCDAGQVAMGGGFHDPTPNTQGIFLLSSHPFDSSGQSGWFVAGRNLGSGSDTITIHVVCVDEA